MRIRSPVAWVLGKYAMHCDTMLVCSAALIALWINVLIWIGYLTDAKCRKILLLLFEWTSRSLVSQRSLFTYSHYIWSKYQDCTYIWRKPLDLFRYPLSNITSRLCPHKSNSRDVWNKIHRLQGHQICPVPLLKFNNQIARDPLEKAQFLIKHYVSASATSNLPKETIAHQGCFERLHFDILNEPGDNLDPINLELTLTELKLAIGSRRKSAVGPDRVSYLMFGNMPDVALLAWLRLFNLVWKVGVVPVAWKEAHVVPVPKPGKDKGAPSSYRPIGLTSQVGKLMECMVKGRLEHLLESRGVLNPFQSGFRKGRSTLDNLAR